MYQRNTLVQLINGKKFLINCDIEEFWGDENGGKYVQCYLGKLFDDFDTCLDYCASKCYNEQIEKILEEL